MRINHALSVVLATLSFIATETFESVGLERFYVHKARAFKKEKGYYDIKHPNQIALTNFPNSINRFAQMDSVHWILHPQCCTRGLVMHSSDGNSVSDILPLPKTASLLDFVAVDSTLYLVDSKMDIYQSSFPFDSTTTLRVSLNSPNWKSSSCCYDRETNRLIFCSSEENPTSRLRSLHFYSISQHRFGKEPLFTFDADAVVEKLHSQNILTNQAATTYALLKKASPEIRPNALAIHPKTNDFYLLCSSDRILLVFSQFGDILAVSYLDECDYSNPTDLRFNERGDLILINQGKKNPSLLCLPWNKLWQYQASNQRLNVFN